MTASLETNINALSRAIIALSCLGVVTSAGKLHSLVVGGLTLAIMFVLYRLHRQFEQRSRRGSRAQRAAEVEEPFTNRGPIRNGGGPIRNGGGDNSSRPAVLATPDEVDAVLTADFHPTTKHNPLGNVLLTDITDAPDRFAAAPSFHPEVSGGIRDAAKKQTQMLNPGIVNTGKQLFGDLKDKYDLDNSMRAFYSMPNTRVGNDQGAFATFLFGDMWSAKESTLEGAIMRVKDSYRHILY